MKENLQNHHVAQFITQKIIEFDYDNQVQSIFYEKESAEIMFGFARFASWIGGQKA
jgi:hypothetical protein